MRTKGSGFSISLVTLGLGLLGFALAQLYGGSGPYTPYTPYPGGQPASLRQVEEVRERASHACWIQDVRVQGTQVLKSADTVGLAYANGGGAGITGTSAFEGVDDRGAPIVISFADVEYFSLKKIEGGAGSGSAILQIRQVPNLSAAELLRIKPTYRLLLNDFSRTLTVAIPLWHNGAALVLVGREYPKIDSEYHTVFELRSLIPDSKVDFRCWTSANEASRDELLYGYHRGPWWAIKSIAYDKPWYPYVVHWMS